MILASEPEGPLGLQIGATETCHDTTDVGFKVSDHLSHMEMHASDAQGLDATITA
jgi:hypothetical protein